MVLIRRLLVFCALLIVASSAFAADDVNLLDWGKGPLQWLLTRDERRAWDKVKTEEQARDFIDLFWARRDPTPGTSLNEFRIEAESRIRFADSRFKEPARRGALTERGRVLIVLGPPKNFQLENEKRTAQMTTAPDGTDPTGGRAMAARDVWNYEHDESVKYKMPKIEVVFIHDGFGGTVRRDPQRTDFTSALPHALDYYIRSPELTSVPEWARGLHFAEARVVEPVPATTSEPEVIQTITTTQTIVDTPKLVAKGAGAGKLTLVADAFAIDAQTGSDPFARLTSVARFKKDGELGWAAEYCTGDASSDLENVNVSLKVSGMIEGKRVNFTSPAEDLAPDAIKGSPGCYLVRGAIPLTEIAPGSYALAIAIAGQQSYNLTSSFEVE